MADTADTADATPPTDNASPVKVKRVMTPAQLENLSAARAKAMEKRQELASIKAREKAVKDNELTERISALTMSEKRSKKRKEPAPSTDSDSDSDTDSDTSDEVTVPKHKAPVAARGTRQPNPKSKPRSKAPLVDLAMAQELVRDELHRRLQKQTYRHAFASLFPGQQNIYD